MIEVPASVTTPLPVSAPEFQVNRLPRVTSAVPPTEPPLSSRLAMPVAAVAANVLDRGTPQDREKSYMLRAGYYQFLHMMAWIAGGDHAAAKYGPEIYRSYGETVADIEKEFGTCQDQ